MSNQIEATTASFPSTTDVPTNTTNEPERIKRLRNSKEKLTQIQGGLEKLVDAMAQNPSILSRVSTFWGKTPLWQKIVTGVVLIAPPLVLGIFIHAIVCFVITAFALASYIGSSIVLDDHYTNTQYSTKNIKSGVTSLAEGLDVIMDSLEQISEALGEQVEIFTEENKKFGENVSTLKTRNEELTVEVEKLRQTEKKLRLTQDELEATCAALKTSNQLQTTLLEETQAQLTKVSIDFTQNQKNLEEKTRELEEINTSLHAEVEKYKNAQQTLKTALQILAEKVTKDETQKNAFLDKLDDFIKKNDITFLEMSETFRDQLSKLKAVEQRYQTQLKEFDQLLSQTDSHVQILKKAPLLTINGMFKPASQESFGATPTTTPTMQ